MNFDLQKLSVRLRSKELYTIGSGLLYVNNQSNYSYVITAAHVVDNANYPIQIECYSDEKTINDEYVFSVCKADVMLHPNYVLTDNPEDKEEFDTAIIRISQKSWMKERNSVFFGNAQVNQKIEGFGYLSQSIEEIIALDVKSITSKESLIINTSNTSNRMKALLRGNFDLDHSDRSREMAGLSGMALAAANQKEMVIVGLAINISGPNGLMGQTTLINLNIAKELLELEGIECKWKKIVNIANELKVEVTKNIIQSTRYFVHREAELEKINNDLHRNNSTVLYGIGGIGKTSLAKHYAYMYGTSYVQSYLIHCSDSIASGIANSIRIEGLDRKRIGDSIENDIQFSQRLLEFIKNQQNYSWLLIFDDVSPRDPFLDQVLELVHHKIFTTRWDEIEWNIPSTKITELPDINSKNDLFEQYLNRRLSSNEIEIFNKIANLVAGHTLTLQLIALQCKESDMTLAEIYESLKTSGIHIDSKDVFIYGKSISEQNMYGHIREIWNLSNFSKNEIRIMQGLSLIAPNGITKKEFKQWLNLDNMNDLNRLFRQGWIQTYYENEHEMIFLHSVIGEVVYHELYITNPENLSVMIAELIKKVNDRSLVVSEQLRYISYGTNVGKRLLISVDAIHLLNLVGLHLEYFRQLEEAFEVLNLANEYVEKMGIKQSIWAGHTLNNLGVIYQTSLDNDHAILYFNKAINIYRDCNEEGKGSLGYALHNVAKSNYFNGDIETALSIEQEAEPLVEKYRSMSLGEIYDIRRECYCYLVMQYNKKYQELLHSRKPVRVLLEKLNQKIKDYINKTLECGELAIKYKKQLKGIDEFSLYDSISNHAVNKAIFRQDEEAKKDMQKVLDFFIRTTGENSVHTGNVYDCMCVVYTQLHELSKACAYGERAVEILSDNLDENHPHLIYAKENLTIAKKHNK